MRPLWATALVHHPVLDRRGDVVTAAVTNLDVHDIARIARTYGAARFYLVTPVAEQQRLVERLLHHWREGYGAGYNPDRRSALELVEIVPDLDAALAHLSGLAGSTAQPLLTGAGRHGGISYPEGRRLVLERPMLLTFGTGWGLAPELFNGGWPVLAPVAGVNGYNHLSVRAAAAIICDRLWGRNEESEVGAQAAP
jgi:hypothetical protein